MTISQTTISPTQNYLGDAPVLRGFYSQRFVAGDAVTPVELGDGLTGFYYSVQCAVNGAGDIVIPAFTIQSTEDGNLPTSLFTGQLFTQSGSPIQQIVFGSQNGNGWKIPILYGANVTWADLFRYNQATNLLNAPPTYPTYAQMLAEILALAGNFLYATVGRLGLVFMRDAPDVASEPKVIGANSYAQGSLAGITRIYPNPDVSSVPASSGLNNYARTDNVGQVQVSVNPASTAAVAATGTFEYNSTPLDGDTITVNGAVFTFRNTPSAINDIQISIFASVLLNNVVNALNASIDSRVTLATYGRIGPGVRITYDVPGQAGNLFTTDSSGVGVSADQYTLTGGINANVPTAVEASWKRLNELTQDITEFLTPDAPPNLGNAVASLGSATPVTLTISTNTAVTANVTVPKNIILRFIGDGYLTISTGFTCTIQSDNGNYPLKKIFYNATAGLGSAVFSGSDRVGALRPQWWGALLDSTTNDTAALTAMAATAALLPACTAKFSGRDHCVLTTMAFGATLSLDFSEGGSLQASVGNTITINGPMIARRQVFYGIGKFVLSTATNPVYQAAWWGETTVTVPAPTAAPTLSAQSTFGYGAGMANGVTYLVAYTYVAWNGETGLSPATSIVAKNSQSLAMQAFASMANNSKYTAAAYPYISADAGVTWHRAGVAYDVPGQIGFGDNYGGYGGAIITYQAGGAAPPAGGTTTTTKTGLTVLPPLVAPKLTNIHANPAGTYYAAIAYLCEDATESALSVISVGFAASAANGILVTSTVEPPSGAVAIRVYMGTAALAASLHLQGTYPLSYVAPVIEDYDSSGAAPSAGAAQSTTSNVQLAYDAMMDSAGAGKIVVGPGPTALKVPLICRLRNSSGAQVTGIQIDGVGGTNAANTASGRLYYAGVGSTAVVGLLVSTSNLDWNGLSIADPSSRLTAGVALGDFVGGGAFYFRPTRSVFEAKKSGSVGMSIPFQLSGSGGGHTASELHALDCVFNGDAWGIDTHGNQTGDLEFRGCNFGTHSNSGSLNSGGVRISGGFNFLFDGLEIGGSAGGYVAYFTGDLPALSSSGVYNAAFRTAFTDAASTWYNYFYVSGSANPVSITVDNSLLGGAVLAGESYALYAGHAYSFVASNVIANAPGSSWSNYLTTNDNTSAPGALPIKCVVAQLGEWGHKLFRQNTTIGFQVTSTSNSDFTDNAQKTSINIFNGRPFREYSAALTQSGGNAPVATPNGNTLGDALTWARSGAGIYTGTCTGAFPSGKTIVFLQMNPPGGTAGIAFAGRTSDNVITVATKDAATNIATDGLLTAASINIKIYYP